MQERLTPDVLLDDDTTTVQRIFSALDKVLESVGVAVDRTPGIPMLSKLSDALYRGCDNTLELSKAMLNAYKHFGTFYPSFGQCTKSSETSASQSTYTRSSLNSSPDRTDSYSKVIIDESSDKKRPLRHL